MRPWVCITAAFLTGLLACKRTDVHNPIPEMRQDAGVAAEGDLRQDAGTGRAPPAAMAAKPFPVRGARPRPRQPESALRSRLGPLLRFRLVPVGAAAVEPAHAAIPVLRQRYDGFAFELGATLVSLPSTAVDCSSFLGSLVGARGTLFIVASPLRCESPFGALDPHLSAAVVLLPRLGATGSPEATRRLQALLASDVGELLGLSYPCADGRTCCLLRTAPDLRVFDARAGVSSCPQHEGS